MKFRNLQSLDKVITPKCRKKHLLVQSVHNSIISVRHKNRNKLIFKKLDEKQNALKVSSTFFLFLKIN